MATADPAMFEVLRRWRRRRIVDRSPIDPADWAATLDALHVLDGLSAEETNNLRELVALFLHAKTIVGAQGFEVTRGISLLIAAQACLPILHLDLDDYRGWRSVVVYPAAFAVEVRARDEAGVVHHGWQERAGEAWERGAVILSWDDIRNDLDHGGYSVVIHEFAHKLDMQNGAANGFPPLHADMDPRRWTAVMQAAFDSLNRNLDHGVETPVDPYAAESPAEFFAVASEYFFLDPATLKMHFPQVYGQLAAFYRQDPYDRQASPG